MLKATHKARLKARLKAKRILCAALVAAVMAVCPLTAGAMNISSVRPVFLSATNTSVPRVLVEGCTVEGGGLSAGTVSELKVTLRNTSSSQSVTSVLVTGRWSSESLPPVNFETTNQVYVSSIGSTQTRDVVFSLKTQDVKMTALDAVSMYLDIKYCYQNGLEATNSVILRIPVTDELSGDFGEVEVEYPGESPQSSGWRLLGFNISKRLVFAGGSAVCALAAVALIIIRVRRG